MTLIDPFVAVIPAAGVGKRLGSKESKQYLSLRGKSILESSIKPLLTLSECKGICIVISSEDSHWRSLDISTRDNISFIEGGSTRIKSSMNGINFWLKGKESFSNILIHDAVRPCLQSKDLGNLLAEFQKSKDLGDGRNLDGMILAIKSANTLKLSHNSTSIIKETFDRSYVWQALTPQIFSREALTKASNLYKDSENYTDESSLVESFGGKVGIVEGSSNNIKITTKEDLKLAEAILLLQNN